MLWDRLVCEVTKGSLLHDRTVAASDLRFQGGLGVEDRVVHDTDLAGLNHGAERIIALRPHDLNLGAGLWVEDCLIPDALCNRL